jgi:hypothetical protein
MREQDGTFFFFAALAAAALGGAACGGGGEVAASSGGTGGAITGAGGGTTTIPVVTTGSTSISGVAPTSGAGGSAPSCPATPPIEGPGITGPDHQWTWIPIDGSRCRDGSQTGFGFRPSSTSKKLFIYLEGGGACFNAATCLIALPSFGKAAFDAWAATIGQMGIFDGGNGQNPIHDWNAIYVPYCSGDVHAGAATGADVPGGPQGQDFTGYENLGLYLQRIVFTFKGADDVLLTGASAGGFGAAFNYDRVAAAFCPTGVAMIDDSGPPMSDQYLAPCLQKQWKGLWNLAATLPTGCACDDAQGGGIVNYITYLQSRWPESRMGLVSSTRDAVISTFYGYGTDDCTSSTPLPGPTYAAGLEDLRQSYLMKGGKWGTYFVNSTTHTYLIGPGFYTTTVQGKPLTAWVGDVLAGQAGNIGP